jgi:hypothetical protein
MNLNDQAEEDVTFDVLFDNSDIVNPQQPITAPLTIYANNEDRREVSSEILFGQDLVKNELPNLNASFVVSKESINKALDILEIRESIKSSNGICREDAEVTNSVLSGFINPARPIGFFTEDKSKTQFNQTLLTLDKEIDIRLVTVAGNLNQQLDSIVGKYLALLKESELKIIDKISNIQEAIGKLMLSLNDANGSLLSNKTINEFLELKIRHYYKDEDSGHLSDLSPELADKVTKLSNCFKGFSFTSKLNCLFINSILSITDKAIYINDSIYKVQSTEPFIDSFSFDDIKEIGKYIDKFHELYGLISLSLSERTLDTLKTYIGLCINILSSFSNRKEKIQAILNNESLNPKDKLDSIALENSIASRDCLIVLTTILFIDEFMKMCECIKDIVTELQPK